MEQEIRQEAIDTPEEIKANILREALFLRDKWHEDADEWIAPSDYATAKDDKETRRLKTEKLNQKRLNKYVDGWFSMIFGKVIQPLRDIPSEDVFIAAVGKEIEALWQDIEQDFKRTESGAELILEEFLQSGDFKSFCSDPNMCADVCELGKGDIFLYGWLRTGQIEQIFEYIWKFQTVQEKFEFSESDFRSYFADKITPLIDKLQAMKRKHTARSPEAVRSGNEILAVVIKESQK